MVLRVTSRTCSNHEFRSRKNHFLIQKPVLSKFKTRVRYRTSYYVVKGSTWTNFVATFRS